MTNEYIVQTLDPMELNEPVFIQAESAEDAREQFIREVLMMEDSNLEYIYSRTINCSYAERIFFQSEEEHALLLAGGGSEISDEEFSCRVYKHFAGYPDYAYLFIKHWLSEDEPSGVVFPEDMIYVMWELEKPSKIGVSRMDNPMIVAPAEPLRLVSSQ